MHINHNMTVSEILSRYPFLMPVFRNNGLGKFENPEVLEKLGPLLKIKTALKACAIDAELFVDLLNNVINEHPDLNNFSISESPERQGELTLLALLPCGMKMPFSNALEKFIEEYNGQNDEKVRYLVEGNVNHEVSYHEYIDKVREEDELPDIIISSDINSFYHRSFMDKFVLRDIFLSLSHEPVNSDFDRVGYNDSYGNFTMLSANLLVVVAVNELMGERPFPKKWEDLLDQKYSDSIVMRGDNNFFCNGVLLPFYKLFGKGGVKKLSESVCLGLHPAEMVKMIDSKKKDIPPLYIMPLFFSEKIKRKERISVISPSEGAIISPVQMLVKKKCAEAVKPLTEYLLGETMGRTCADAFFPSTNPRVNNKMKGIKKMYWPGWDFIYNENIGEIKEEISNIFMEKFERE